MGWTRILGRQQAPVPADRGEDGFRLWQAASAEFVAVLLFIFLGCGAVVVSGEMTGGGMSVPRLILIAAVHGLGITALVYATINISGGHINPAVTVTMLATRQISGARALTYLGAQLGGAAVGALLLLAVVPGASENNAGEPFPGSWSCTVGRHVNRGGPDIRPGLCNLHNRGEFQGAAELRPHRHRTHRVCDQRCRHTDNRGLSEPGPKLWSGRGGLGVGRPLGLLGRPGCGWHHRRVGIPVGFPAPAGLRTTFASGRDFIGPARLTSKRGHSGSNQAANRTSPYPRSTL